MNRELFGYSFILLISIFAMIISIVIEYNYPIINNTISRHLTKTILYRTSHYYIFFYCSLYALFFLPYGLHSYIYLIINLLLNIQWCVLRCCILSYYEIINYECNYKNFSTKFHPYIFTILRNWSDPAMDIVGIIIIWNIFRILYYNRKIPLFSKTLYILIFGYSVYMCCTGKNPVASFINPNTYENHENKVLEIKKEIQRIDELFMYPTDPNSFFMKYIA